MVPKLRQTGDVYFTPEEEEYILNEADTQGLRTKLANEILRERKEKAPRAMRDPGFLEHLRKVKEAGMTDEDRARAARAHKTFEKLTKDADVRSDLRVEIPERRSPAKVISPTATEISSKITEPHSPGRDIEKRGRPIGSVGIKKRQEDAISFIKDIRAESKEKYKDKFKEPYNYWGSLVLDAELYEMGWNKTYPKTKGKAPYISDKMKQAYGVSK
jgi:hypothetical protein